MSFKIFNVVRLIYGVYNIKRGSRKLPSRHGLTIFQCVECEQRLVRFFRIILKGGNFLIAINLPRIWFGSFFLRKPSFFPRTKVSGESFTRVNGLLTGWRSSNSLYSFPHFPKFNSLISVFRGKWTNSPVWIVTKAYHEDGRWIFRQRLAIGLTYNGGRFRCSRATLHFPSSHLPLSVFYTHIFLSFSLFQHHRRDNYAHNFFFSSFPLNSSCFRKRDSLDEVQERETLSDSSRILYYRSTMIFYRYVNATERERCSREEGAFLLIRFTFRGRIVLHSTRFVSQSPFHSSTSWIIDFQGDTTRGLTLLKITVGSILGRRASLQRGNKDRLLLLLLSLFPLFAEKYAVASTSEFHREGYRLCYKFLISR